MRAFEGEYSGRPAGISFREIKKQDMGFLRQLYSSTRSDEMAMVPWPQEQKDTFLNSQFDAQHQFYQDQFAEAAFLLVEMRGKPVGRVYLDRRQDELRLIDIAIAPDFRGQGLGTALLKELLEECRKMNLPARIHVEKNNPAMNLYARVGFKPVEDQGVYDLMEWTPKIS